MGTMQGGKSVWRSFLWRSLLSLAGIYAAPAWAEKITIAADEWCPYNCQPNTEAPGILVELAKAAWQPMGFTVDYQVLPWTRAKHQAIQSGDIGLLGAGRGLDEQLFLYGKISPLVSPFCFFTKADKSWSFFGTKSLASVRLGTTAGYNYDGEVGQYVRSGILSGSKQVEAAVGDVPILQNLERLQADRIDVVLEDRLVMQYHNASLSPRQKIREAGCIIGDDTIYLVLPKKMKQASQLMHALDDYIMAARKDGSFKRLLQKYGITVKAY